MFGATNIVKNGDKSKHVYSGYGIMFDSAGPRRFGTEIARTSVSFGTDNSLSSHTNNDKNNFLVLGEAPTDDINGSVGTAETKLKINFGKAKTKFCLSLHYNGDNSYMFINRKEMHEFKADRK